MLSQDEQWLLNEKYGGIKCPEFAADRLRLMAGEPLAYVIGHTPFLDRTIYLHSKPLIPRPETEYWTEKAIFAVHEASAASPHPLRVLDLCAGSGAIGIAVAMAIQRAHVTFIELDPTHAATIEHNLRENEIAPERTTVMVGDLFTALPPDTPPFDLILSNPPYVDPALDRTEPSVKDFEPHLALYGGVGGLELIRRIIERAPRYLTESGQLWIEHEPEQTAAIATIAEANDLFAITYPDQYHTLRYSVLTLAVPE